MRDKLLAVPAVVIVLTALCFFFLLTSTSRWEAGVLPLTVEEIAKTSDRVSAKNQRQPEVLEHSTNDAEMPIGASTPSETRLPPFPARLASVPTEEQRLDRFEIRTGPDGRIEIGTVRGRMSRKLEITLEKLVFGSLSRISLVPPVTSLPGDIGHRFADMQEFESARPYLREAVRVEHDAVQRGHYCGYLAWLEDDPQVAAALIEQSLDAPLLSEGRGEASRAINALTLAIATGTDELAEYSFQRYRLSWSQWLGNHRAAFGVEPREWIENRIHEDESADTGCATPKRVAHLRVPPRT